MIESSYTKGVIFDIKKFAVHDGPGIRTTVFFKGCPLDCFWCHNPESRIMEPEIIKKTNIKSNLRLSYSETVEYIGRTVTADEVMHEIKKDIAYYDESGGGVTFSGGEPLMQPDFLSNLLQLCKENDINTAVDTTGYAPLKILKNISDYTDLFLYDLKLIDEKEHIYYTNVSNKVILNNLKTIYNFNKNIIIRIPIIPGITDTEKNLISTIDYLNSINPEFEINLLPYNKLGQGKLKKINRVSMQDKFEVPSQEHMEKIKNKFTRGNQFSVKIGG